MLDDLTTWVTDVIDALGYVGVAFLVALENVFPPIPSEVVLPLAGFVAGRGDASLPGMILASTVGSVVGAWVLYGISAAIGPIRLHAFLVRYGKWVGVRERDLVRAEAWFDRRSDVAVFFGRLVPLIRSVVSVPAGFRRMNFLRFTMLTAAGSLIWNAALVGAGAVLGDRWEEVGDTLGLFQALVILAIGGLVALWLWKRFVSPRLTRLGSGPGSIPREDPEDG